MTDRKKLLELIENVGVNIHNIEKDDFNRSFDSLQFISLICDIEKEFNINIPDELLVQSDFSNIEEFISKIEAEIRSQHFI